nr:protein DETOXIFICATION 29 isoform X1 [Ipomoea batatas]
MLLYHWHPYWPRFGFRFQAQRPGHLVWNVDWDYCTNLSIDMDDTKNRLEQGGFCSWRQNKKMGRRVRYQRR